MGVRGMKRFLTAALHLIAPVAIEIARQLLPSWMLGAGSPDSHGGSRWARSHERRRLGRLSKPASMHGDGIVLGWHAGGLLESPAEDNVILLAFSARAKRQRLLSPRSWVGAALRWPPRPKKSWWP